VVALIESLRGCGGGQDQPPSRRPRQAWIPSCWPGCATTNDLAVAVGVSTNLSRQRHKDSHLVLARRMLPDHRPQPPPPSATPAQATPGCHLPQHDQLAGHPHWLDRPGRPVWMTRPSSARLQAPAHGSGQVRRRPAPAGCLGGGGLGGGGRSRLSGMMGMGWVDDPKLARESRTAIPACCRSRWAGSASAGE